MKNIVTAEPINAADYAAWLREKIPPLFKEHRQTDIPFDVRHHDNTIEIWQTDMYEGFLFRIGFDGENMHITKSEHYVDDVNVLTLEDILNALYLEYPGRNGIRYIDERS